MAPGAPAGVVCVVVGPCGTRKTVQRDIHTWPVTTGACTLPLKVMSMSNCPVNLLRARSSRPSTCSRICSVCDATAARSQPKTSSLREPLRRGRRPDASSVPRPHWPDMRRASKWSPSKRMSAARSVNGALSNGHNNSPLSKLAEPETAGEDSAPSTATSICALPPRHASSPGASAHTTATPPSLSWKLPSSSCPGRSDINSRRCCCGCCSSACC
mmetsp:Transcript_14685/g.43077  ORF Transcript_14685/g.43077 Transcript_14685/m.43077 type:complete len:215 (-) Transcript_14685:2922-3566(-)